MIKVKNIRDQKLSEITDKYIGIIPVVDGELMLIPDANGEYISCLQANLPHEKGYRGFCKPIIISLTENIENGEWFLRDGYIHQATFATKYHEQDRKILALPEDFSPEQIKDIVDGKLKEGKVVLECDELNDGNGMVYDPYKSRFQIELDPYINVYQHSTFNQIKPKTYTDKEVEGLLRKFADHVDDLYRVHTSSNTLAFDSLYGYGESKEKWLDQLFGIPKELIGTNPKL